MIASRWWRLVALALAAALVVAACGDDDDATPSSQSFVVLDGTPRVADAAGRLVEVADDFSTVTLDGDRTYDVDPALQAFSTRTAEIVPLLRLERQFVLVGLDGDTLQWIAGVGAVVEVPDEAPVVYFTDVLVDVADGAATFRSGTVLDVADGAVPPGEPPVAVVATISVDDRAVVAFEPG